MYCCFFRYLRAVPGFLLIVTLAVESVNLWLNDADLPLLIAVGGFAVASFFALLVEYVYPPFEGMFAFHNSKFLKSCKFFVSSLPGISAICYTSVQCFLQAQKTRNIFRHFCLNFSLCERGLWDFKVLF